MIESSLLLVVFELLFCRSSAISRKASLSIPRWIPRLGHQSGYENSLSYAILYLMHPVATLDEILYYT